MDCRGQGGGGGGLVQVCDGGGDDDDDNDDEDDDGDYNAVVGLRSLMPRSFDAIGA
jgi:hypothetical protein